MKILSLENVDYIVCYCKYEYNESEVVGQATSSRVSLRCLDNEMW